MAVTYTLIQKTELTSTAFDVLFSSIPNTYDDLEIKIVGRSTAAQTYVRFRIWVNNQTNDCAFAAWKVTNASAIVSQNDATVGYFDFDNASFNGASSNASTFSSCKIYFPAYKRTTYNKVFQGELAQGNNTSATSFYLFGGTHTDTAAITDIGFRVRDTSGNAVIFDVGTSIYLYGIKNS